MYIDKKKKKQKKKNENVYLSLNAIVEGKKNP